MRRSDLHNASELRARLERAGSAEWIELRALRIWFGGKRLSTARRRRIAAALTIERIDVYPPLLGRPAPKRVRLEVLPDEQALPASRRRALNVWGRIRTRLLTPLGAGVTLAASVATLGAALVALTADGPPAPGRMSGDLNVAVAAFTTNGGTTEEGIALARDAARVLSSELPHLDRSLDVEVRGPGAVGAVDGTNGESQARAALSLAQAIGADIVVYGDLAAGPRGTRLQPAFYLNTAKLPSAGSLGGGYAYGGPITLPYDLAVSPPARAQVRAALIRRTEAYAQAFIGAGYYLLHALPRAELHLRHALVRAPTPAVAALLRLLLGNIANQQGHTVMAARDYSMASHDAATRIRAQLGLADVRYKVAHRHCQAGELSASRLSSARRRFATVLHALGGIAAAQAGSPLAAKAVFGEGQVDLCLSAAGHGRWRAAHRELAATIAAYSPGVPELRDDAAEAYAGLGLYDVSVEQAPIAYEDAQHEYSVAAKLTTLDSRRAYFDGAVGFADAHLGEYSSAVTMFERGARLAGATSLGGALARKAEQLTHKTRVAR
jgi:tetratricopeptide (TPR) repeat protein